VQLQGRFVDRAFDIEEGDHGLGTHVTEHRDFPFHVVVEGILGAADNNIGSDPDLAQLRDALLGRFGLELFGRFYVGDESGVHEGDIFMADFVFELTQRFEEGQPLDVPRGAADLGGDDIDVGLLCHFVNAVFDDIGDVRNHLHRRAEVKALAFVLDDGLVDLPARDVVEFGKAAAREAFVVPEIEVGLGAVVEHVDFAVLEGAHRAGIDVQIRVELLHENAQTAALQQRSEGGCRETFPERADHASCHKNVLH